MQHSLKDTAKDIDLQGDVPPESVNDDDINSEKATQKAESPAPAKMSPSTAAEDKL